MAQTQELRKRLEEKDGELTQLNDVNMKLKEKILEFQSYNQQNVDTAKVHIAQLNQSLEERQGDIEERERREQELEARISSMARKWTERQAGTQTDIFEERARQFSEH